MSQVSRQGPAEAHRRPTMVAALAVALLGALLMVPAPCLAARKAMMDDLEPFSSAGNSRSSASRAGGRRRLLHDDDHTDILEEPIGDEYDSLFGAFEAAYDPCIGSYGGYGLYGYYGSYSAYGGYGVYYGETTSFVDIEMLFDDDQLLAADWEGPLPVATPIPFPRRALREGMLDGEIELPLLAVDYALEYDMFEANVGAYYGGYGYYVGGSYGMYYGSMYGGYYGGYGGEYAIMDEWLMAEAEAQSILDEYMDKRAADLLAESMEAGDAYMIE